MRVWVVLIGIVLAAGCVEHQLTPVEMEVCLSHTQSNITHTPFCLNQETCAKEWREGKESRYFSVSSVRAEKSLIEAWVNLNQAQKALEETRSACTSANVVKAFEQGVEGAVRLRQALYEGEQAQLASLAALREVLDELQPLELERVRDTVAFESYAAALNQWQDIQTGQYSGEVGEIWEENNRYWEEIGEAIQGSEAAAYTVNEKSGFDWYSKTARGWDVEYAKQVLIFSPVWQSVISAVLQEYDTAHFLTLVGKIRASEMVEGVEKVVSPERGIVPKILRTIYSVREGVQRLREEENEYVKEGNAELKLLEEMVENLEEYEKAEWISTQLEKWDTDLKSKVTVREAMQKILVLREKFSILQQEKAGELDALGSRIERWREWKRELNQVKELKEEMGRVELERKNACVRLAEEWGKKGNRVMQERAKNVHEENIHWVEVCEAFLVALNEAVENQEGNLAACSEKAEEYARALGETALEAGDWAVLFGNNESARVACESALGQLRYSYENEFSILEWNTILQHIGEMKNQLYFVQQTRPELLSKTNVSNTQKKLEDFWNLYEGEIIAWNEVEDRISEGRMLEESGESGLVDVLLEYRKQMKWQAVGVVKEGEKGEWVFVFANPFGSALRGEKTVPIEVPGWMSIEEGREVEQGIVKVSLAEWGKEGVKVKGSSFTSGVQQNETRESLGIVGNRVQVESVISWSGAYFPIELEWKWEAPEGGKGVLARKGGVVLTPKSVGDKWVFETVVEGIEREVEIRYEVEGGVVQQVKVSGLNTILGESETTYEWEVRNQMDFSVSGSFLTSIVAEPAFVNRVEVENENGKKEKFTIGSGNQIILNEIELLPGEMKTFYIRVWAPEDIGVWKAQAQSMLLEIQLLKEKVVLIKKWEVQIVEQEVMALLESKNAQAFAAGLPKIRSKLDKLTNEWEMEKVKLDGLYLEFLKTKEEAGEKQVSLSEWENRMEEAYAQGREVLLRNGLDEMKTKLKGIQTTDVQKEFWNEEVKGLLLNNANQILEKIEIYKKGLGVSCTKLSEVGYVCPLDEKQIKSLGDEVKKQVKTIERTEDVLEFQVGEWENVFARQLETVDEAYAQMRGMAVLSMEKIEGENGEEQVREAIEKGLAALEKEEWGKAIYIGENVKQYLGQKSPGIGLVSFPLESWPIVGIAVIAGGMWAYRQWKEKNKPEIVLKKIPRANLKLEKHQSELVISSPQTRVESQGQMQGEEELQNLKQPEQWKK